MLAVGFKGLNPVFPTAWSSGTVLSLLIAQSLAVGLATIGSCDLGGEGMHSMGQVPGWTPGLENFEGLCQGKGS